MSRNRSLARISGLSALAMAALLGLASAEPARADFVGSLAGWVKDDSGAPRMGAAVAVLTKDGRLAKRVFTDDSGRFLAEGLVPGEYAVRVTLSRFLPLLKESVQVRSGLKTILDVNLRGLFTSLQLVYPATGEIRDMTDEWKWTLRASQMNRPPLRVLPSYESRERERLLRKVSGAFSDTRAYAQVSSGAGGRQSGLANESDLGTSFAVATSLFGDNNVRVSGNVGYSAVSQSPTTAFRTSYRREIGLGAPEVSVTVRQLQRTAFADRAFLNPQGGGPALQTFTIGFGDRVKLGENTDLEYGALYESVTFARRLDFISPYGKIVHRLSPRRQIELRYASGAPRPDSGVAGGERLRQDVSSLGLFPRVALLEGDATVQRTEHMEVAYREELGANMIEAGVFQDTMTDAALSAFVPENYQSGGDVLPDLFSRAATVNAGRHFSRGFRVSYARRIADRLEAALGYGMSGALMPNSPNLQVESVRDVRNDLAMSKAHMVMASVAATVPLSDTRIVTAYQWLSRDSAIGVDLYNEFAARSDPGLNIIIRQPLPFKAGLPGKLEASADVRNLLKAGYIPIDASDGQTLYLLQAIRSYRGSLSFIF